MNSMKKCLSCNCSIIHSEWICSNCNWSPKYSEGFLCFAPEIDGASDSYDPSWYSELALLEAQNFWFVSRNELIAWVSSVYLSKSGSFLEIGCGTGYVLQMLRNQFPYWNIYASEAQLRGLAFAKMRSPSGVEFFQMDATLIPFKHEFDFIGAFDVIEHISNDSKVLSQIHQALRSDGILLLTVPQHMFLWSKYDEVGCHYRRYACIELEDKLRSAGFQVLFSTSFNTILMPLMIISRFLLMFKQNQEVDVLQELKLPSFLNFFLLTILRFEIKLIKFGIRFPFGGSRVILAKKLGVIGGV